jgi:hypothetical protein
MRIRTEVMPGQHYYLLSSLPALGELGSEPPITRSRLLEKVAESAGPREIVESLLLGDDLLQRDALLAGEISADQADPVVLTLGQMRDEQPLPSCLAAGEREQMPRVAADAVWADYFRHAAAVGQRTGSEFLTGWTGFEVALRNAVASQRAKALGLDGREYLVAVELADRDADLTALVGEWSAATDGLAAQRLLDHARWDWIAEHDGRFTYADDELAAYAARLSLLHRWHRLRKHR